jgi:glucose-6-phosphate-specific signal transduction histidine kinase
VPGSNRAKKITIYVGVFALIAFVFAMQSYMSATLKGKDAFFLGTLKWAVSDWGPRMVLFPIVISMASRFPLDRDHWARNLPMHLLGFALFTVAQSWMYLGLEALTDRWWESSMTVPALMALYLTKSAAMNLLVYAAGVALVQGLSIYEMYRERERRTLQLQGELATAHLEALRGQLQPHFLFNTLNTVTALLRRDPDGAERVITRLGDLLRISLQNTSRQEIPLHEELDFLDRFLEIQQVRFQDRLTVRRDVAPDTLDAAVPTLLLQPLVENAIKHGIEPNATAGVVTIRAQRRDEELLLEVCDNGNGLPAGGAASLREGVGIANTRARLEQLYGEHHRFDLRDGDDGGVCVSITIPFRPPGPGQGSR